MSETSQIAATIQAFKAVHDDKTAAAAWPRLG
jgi:hypothetical protein